MKKTIVISAINIRSGGALTILQNCLQYLSNSSISNEYRIIALVHRKELANYPDIEYIEYPKSISSWFLRIYYEYFGFKSLSKKLKPFLWLSLHDLSPRVSTERQAVYMHNPSMSHKIKVKDLKYDKKYIVFALFYKFAYKLNIKSNDYIIVQQSWLRNIISEKFLINKQKIIVARPNSQILHTRPQNYKNVHTFIFPSFPRPFKNFEVICEACEKLEALGINDYRVYLTIDGSEAKYSKDIINKYSKLKTIEFTGLLSKEKITELYEKSDCLIFPSRLETWGLPISEFIPFGRPIISVDLPYAHETTMGADLVAFFKNDDANRLAKLMEDLIAGEYHEFGPVKMKVDENPFADTYKDMFNILLN